MIPSAVFLTLADMTEVGKWVKIGMIVAACLVIMAVIYFIYYHTSNWVHGFDSH